MGETTEVNENEDLGKCLCGDCPFSGFKKIMTSKQGLTVYVFTHECPVCEEKYTGAKEKQRDITMSVETGEENTVIVIQNPNENDNIIQSADFDPEFDINKVSCPRCRHKMTQARKLLASVSLVEKKDILSVCDVCALNQIARAPCHVCQKVISQVEDTGMLNSDLAENIKKKIFNYLTNAERLLKTVIKPKEGKLTRSLSYTNIAKILERRDEYQQILRRPKSGPVLDATLRYEWDLESLNKIKSEKKMEIKKDTHDKADEIHTPLKPIRDTSQMLPQDVPCSSRLRKVSKYSRGVLKKTVKSDTVLGVGTTGMMRRSYSDDSMITSFTRIRDKIFQRNLKYLFPRSVKKEFDVLKTSEDLIKETRDKFREEKRREAEITKKKQDEIRKRKIQREQEKRAYKAELARKIELAKRQGIIPVDDNKSYEIDKKTGLLVEKKRPHRSKKPSKPFKDSEGSEKTVEKRGDKKSEKKGKRKGEEKGGKKEKRGQAKKEESEDDTGGEKRKDKQMGEKKEKRGQAKKGESEDETGEKKRKDKQTGEKKQKRDQAKKEESEDKTGEKMRKDKKMGEKKEKRGQAKKEQSEDETGGKKGKDKQMGEKKEKRGQAKKEVSEGETGEKKRKDKQMGEKKERPGQARKEKNEDETGEKKRKDKETGEKKQKRDQAKKEESEDKTGKKTRKDKTMGEKKEKLGHAKKEQSEDETGGKKRQDKQMGEKKEKQGQAKKEESEDQTGGKKREDKNKTKDKEKPISHKPALQTRQTDDKHTDKLQGMLQHGGKLAQGLDESKKVTTKKVETTGEKKEQRGQAKKEESEDEFGGKKGIDSKDKEKPRLQKPALQTPLLDESKKVTPKKSAEITPKSKTAVAEKTVAQMKDAKSGPSHTSIEEDELQDVKESGIKKGEKYIQSSKSIEEDELQDIKETGIKKEEKHIKQPKPSKEETEIKKEEKYVEKPKPSKEETSITGGEKYIKKPKEEVTSTKKGKKNMKDPKPSKNDDDKAVQKSKRDGGVDKEHLNLLKKVLNKQDEKQVKNLKLKAAEQDKVDKLKQIAAKKTQLGSLSQQSSSIEFYDPSSKKTPFPKKLETKLDGGKKPIQVDMNKIQLASSSGDDLVLKLISLYRRDDRKAVDYKGPITAALPILKKRKKVRQRTTESQADEDESEDDTSILTAKEPVRTELVYGTKVVKAKDVPPEEESLNQPTLFQKVFHESYPGPSPLPEQKPEETAAPVQGAFRYALSDRKYIANGWTKLPEEKIIRKMNIYDVKPVKNQFDWFKHNKGKNTMMYPSGEKMATIDDTGHGRWFYKNGRIALDFYECAENNAQQRFVLYSSGDVDSRGRSQPVTVLGMFDHIGNGIVFDHQGKIRLKYNQSEGVLLDRSIGPASHWQWHSLNDPPVLQQVMIDTKLTYKDPELLAIAEAERDTEGRVDDEQMLAIEFENFVKSSNVKPAQKFEPHQIKLKALKINDQFSLRIQDQKNIYLQFREGSQNLKLNLGMELDHTHIIETGSCELGEVSLTMEHLPAVTASIECLQKQLAMSQNFNRVREQREAWKRPPQVNASGDALSKPLRPPPLNADYKYRSPSVNNLYYNTRLI